MCRAPAAGDETRKGESEMDAQPSNRLPPPILRGEAEAGLEDMGKAVLPRNTGTRGDLGHRELRPLQKFLRLVEPMVLYCAADGLALHMT